MVCGVHGSTIDEDKVNKKLDSYFEEAKASYIKEHVDPILKELEKDPKNTALKLKLGVTYARLNMLDKAIEIFYELKDNPQVESKVIFYLANCFNAMGDNEKALKHYRSALQKEEQKSVRSQKLEALIHINIAVLYKKKFDNQKVDHHFKKAIVLNTNYILRKEYFYSQDTSATARAVEADKPVDPGVLAWE